MFFNKFKPEKEYAAIKEWLLSLRSKYENMSSMSDFIKVIDEELENLDYMFESGYLNENKAQEIRNYIDRKIDIYKEQYSVPTEEQEDVYSNDETSNTVNSYNESDSDVISDYESHNSFSSSSDVDYPEETASDNEDSDNKLTLELVDSCAPYGKKKFNKYRVSLYVPTNIPSDDPGLANLMNYEIAYRAKRDPCRLFFAMLHMCFGLLVHQNTGLCMWRKWERLCLIVKGMLVSSLI